VLKRFSIGVCLVALAAASAACGGSGDTTTNTSVGNANNNAATTANTSGATAGTRTAPDNSEIVRETSGGVTTETRTFKDPNSRVERVVVTTRDGRRTARVYYRDKTVRELPESEIEQVFGMTAEALVNAGGRVIDVSKEAGNVVADKVEDVPNEVDDAARAAGRGAKKVGSEAADKAEDVGDAAASGAKKAAKGAKKVGGAVKDAITP